jgi:RNA polymerase sigma-70 factor (ECF subfamily)
MTSDLTGLALAAQAGDRVALNAFVRAAQYDVWRLCAHLVGRADADDVAQETFVRALRALSSFRGESSARTWLLSIAHRTAVDHIRRAQRRRLLAGRLRTRTRNEPVVPDGAASTELDALLAAIAVERREAFVLTQLIGLSYDEAARVLDVPLGTIRSRVARARADLIDAWGDEAVG